jgi:tetratricopeptide (TPR) repeat protein
MKLFEESVAVFQKALEIDDLNQTILNNLGNSLMNLKQYKEALTYFDEALSIDPNYKLALINKKILSELE